MIFEYINVDNSREIVSIEDTYNVTDKWININTSTKKEFIKKFLSAYKSNQKIVLFDSNHKQLVDFYNKNDINKLEMINKVNEKSKLLFFTSGSSGFPVGAFKSFDNINEEIKVLHSLVEKYKIKKVVVTVPFVHIYGVLAGLLLPLSLDNITLIVKEDFLPYELLDEAKDSGTLVITTPVFIKALSKLSKDINLNKTIFISSTGPLYDDDINLLESKYKTNIMQLFGSTETGGIAYKYGNSLEWTPMKNVEIKLTKENKLSVKSKFISPYIIDNNILKLEQPFITEDIIELKNDNFKLIGRSNKLIKIAGKRISALQIETQLEKINGVKNVVVELVYKKELLRSEQIKILVQSENKLSKKIIKDKLSEAFGVLTIPFTVKYVDNINLSAMGKKIIF